MTILINIGKQGDGCVYELHPLSRRDLKAKYPDVRPAPSVFIGYNTRDEFESLHGPMWSQVAQMLTGLGPSQIRKLGGAQIYDPVAEREIAKV
ncbi:MAG TPA: hypothetical protein PK156_10845 [Polyangium sp.]|nr:hypothetical protein [Polyangium sp.]